MVDLKKQAPTIALLFTLLVFLSYSVSWVRMTIGTAMDVVLGPLIDPEGFAVPFFVMIIILSSLTGLYSSLVQKYTIDYEKMQETQAKMRVFQKEFREAQLSGDEKRIKKLQKKAFREFYLRPSYLIQGLRREGFSFLKIAKSALSA